MKIGEIGGREITTISLMLPGNETSSSPVSFAFAQVPVLLSNSY